MCLRQYAEKHEFRVPAVIYAPAILTKGLMNMKRENAPIGLSASVALLLVVLGMSACGPRRLNVVHTVQETLVTVGYSAERSQSIFRADNEAQMYCERRKKGVLFIKQDTLYQGRYDEDVTATARTA